MVAGVDLSTRAIDIVTIDQDRPAHADHHHIPLVLGWWEEAGLMRQTLTNTDTYGWLYDREVHLAGIERPYSSKHQIGTAVKLYTILGALLDALPSRILAFPVTPVQMRHELGLKGTCPKADMQFAVWTQLGGPRDWPPDADDAWAAAYAALRINERAAQENPCASKSTKTKPANTASASSPTTAK